MQYAFAFVMAMLGFVAGKFLALPLLVTITVVCIFIGLYLAMTKKEIEGLLTVIFCILAAIFNLAMWVTYYLATHPSGLGDFIQTYISR